MVTFLSLVAVGCIALSVYIASSAVAIGLLEILGIAVFGCVAAICIILLSVYILGRYTGHKVKTRIKEIRIRAKKLKR